MVTSSITSGAGAVSRYVLRLEGEQDASLPRVFGRVSRAIDDTTKDLSRMQAELQDQKRALKQVGEGSREYEELQRSIRSTERAIGRLTDDLDRQQRSWRRLNQVGNTARNTFLGLSGVMAGLGAGLILQVDNVGRSAAQLLAVSRETGLELEYLQRLQLQVRAVGMELEADEFREINVRLGEASLGEGTAAEALERLGFNARQVASRDIPLVLAAIQKLESREQRQFFADEIFGGQIAERIIPTFDLPPDQVALLEETTVLSRQQAEQFQAARVELEALKAEFYAAAASAGSALLPILRDILGVVSPIVVGISDWVKENPKLVAGLAAAAGALTGIIGIIWLLNTALAVRAALTPGVGWAALGLAAAVGLTAAGAGAAAMSRGNKILEENQAQSVDQVRQGTYEGYREAAREERDATKNTLQNILRDVPCPEEDASAAGAGELSPDQNMQGYDGLDPAAAVRLAVAQSRLIAEGEGQTLATVNRRNQVRTELENEMERAGVTNEDYRKPTEELSPFEMQDRLDALKFRARFTDPPPEPAQQQQITAPNYVPDPRVPPYEGFIGPLPVPEQVAPTQNITNYDQSQNRVQYNITTQQGDVSHSATVAGDAIEYANSVTAGDQIRDDNSQWWAGDSYYAENRDERHTNAYSERGGDTANYGDSWLNQYSRLDGDVDNSRNDVRSYGPRSSSQQQSEQLSVDNSRNDVRSYGPRSSSQQQSEQLSVDNSRNDVRSYGPRSSSQQQSEQMSVDNSHSDVRSYGPRSSSQQQSEQMSVDNSHNDVRSYGPRSSSQQQSEQMSVDNSHNDVRSYGPRSSSQQQSEQFSVDNSQNSWVRQGDSPSSRQQSEQMSLDNSRNDVRSYGPRSSSQQQSEQMSVDNSRNDVRSYGPRSSSQQQSEQMSVDNSRNSWLRQGDSPSSQQQSEQTSVDNSRNDVRSYGPRSSSQQQSEQMSVDNSRNSWIRQGDSPSSQQQSEQMSVDNSRNDVRSYGPRSSSQQQSEQMSVDNSRNSWIRQGDSPSSQQQSEQMSVDNSRSNSTSIRSVDSGDQLTSADNRVSTYEGGTVTRYGDGGSTHSTAITNEGDTTVHQTNYISTNEPAVAVVDELEDTLRSRGLGE